MPVTPDQWDALGVRGPLHLAHILEAKLEEREVRGDARVVLGDVRAVQRPEPRDLGGKWRAPGLGRDGKGHAPEKNFSSIVRRFLSSCWEFRS